MQFILFTEKTTHQCMKALHERIQATETKTRPALEGWIEKNGSFSIAMSRRVVGNFKRTTRLRGSAERDKGVTVIRGFVPEGVSRNWLMVIGGAVALLAIFMVTQGQLLPAIVIAVVGALIVASLWGDYRNHDILLYELEKTLKAKPAPPGTKVAPPKKRSSGRASRKRQTAKKRG